MKQKLSPVELQLLQLQILNLKYIFNVLNIVLTDLIPIAPDISENNNYLTPTHYKDLIVDALLKTNIQLEILNDLYNEQ
jgi:hypothetical protein